MKTFLRQFALIFGIFILIAFAFKFQSGTTKPEQIDLGQLVNENYSSAELNKTNNTLIFTITASPDMSVLWRWYWCAANREILDRNMEEIDMRFVVNNQEIPREEFAQLIFKNKDSIFKDWMCFTYETVLRDWKPGIYQLKQTETFKSQINDGRDTFPAGYKTYEYILSISQ